MAEVVLHLVESLGELVGERASVRDVAPHHGDADLDRTRKGALGHLRDPGQQGVQVEVSRRLVGLDRDNAADTPPTR